jgi:DNA polymerase
MNYPITDRNGLPFVGFDTETLFTADYSVSDLGPQGYVNDPRFDCYLISIDAPDFNWVGHPRGCPWEKLRNRSFVSANAGFDQAVLRRMIELGQAPAWVYPEEWVCSANLSVFCGYARALAKTVEALFGHKVDKSIRNVDMKGKTLDTMSPELATRVKEYALDDAKWCRLVWEELAPQWPVLERRISDLTYRMGAYGLHTDAAGVDRDIATLEQAKAAAFEKIPWTKDVYDDQIIRPAAQPLSPRALREYCASVNILPPASLAKDSEECAAWEARYGADYPVVAAMRDYRRTNTLLEKYYTIRRRINSEGRMPFSLKYFGASTGRWSGDSGVNIQNLPKEPMFFDENWGITMKKTDRSVEMRPKFTAAPGKRFLIVDYAQIEARVTPWLAGDEETLELIRAGVSVYDVQGLRNKMLDDPKKSLKKVNKALYAVCKAQVLGLDFGCGWFKYISFAKASLRYEPGVFEQVFGAPVSDYDRNRFCEYIRKYDKRGDYTRGWPKLSPPEQDMWVNSWLQVTNYRALNPKKVGLWRRLGDDVKRSVGGLYEIELPSGRVLKYFDVHIRGDSVYVCTTKGGTPSMVTGPLLTENLVQGTARDVLAEALVRLDDAGIRVVATVHDEVVCEVDDSVSLQRVIDLMTVTPKWAAGLPLGAEGEVSLHYKK